MSDVVCDIWCEGRAYPNLVCAGSWARHSQSMKKTFLPETVLVAALRSAWLDRICKLRSADLMRKSHLGRLLPREGLILDLGCGLAHVSEAVLDGSAGRECVMIDPIWSPTPRVKERIGSRAHFIAADGASLPFPNSTFLAAWTSAVLHHVEMAPKLTGHGLPLNKCEAYNRVYDQPYGSR